MITLKQQMKVLSITVKYLPLFIALMYFINSVLSLCNIYISAITFVCSCGFIPLILIYICCSVLKYCNQYKAYLLYIAINNIVNWIDYHYSFTENILIGWIVVLGIFFILISYIMYRHIVKGEAVL